MKDPWWRNLDDNRQRVMANMCFNLGHPRLSNFKKFIGAMQISDWETAAVEMMDSKWAGQVGNRAVRLRDRVLQEG
jgi:lysozyme